jgi:hypothetical protein
MRTTVVASVVFLLLASVASGQSIRKRLSAEAAGVANPPQDGDVRLCSGEDCLAGQELVYNAVEDCWDCCSGVGCGDIDPCDPTVCEEGDLLTWDDGSSCWACEPIPTGSILCTGTTCSVGDELLWNVDCFDCCSGASCGDVVPCDPTGCAAGDLLIWDADSSCWACITPNISVPGGGRRYLSRTTSDTVTPPSWIVSGDAFENFGGLADNHVIAFTPNDDYVSTVATGPLFQLNGDGAASSGSVQLRAAQAMTLSADDGDITVTDTDTVTAENDLNVQGLRLHVGDDTETAVVALGANDGFIEGVLELATIQGADIAADTSDQLQLTGAAGEGNATPTANNDGGSVYIYPGSGSLKRGATSGANGGHVDLFTGSAVNATGSDNAGSGGNIDFGTSNGATAVSGNAGDGGYIYNSTGIGGGSTGAGGSGGDGGPWDLFVGGGGFAQGTSAANGGAGGALTMIAGGGGTSQGTGANRGGPGGDVTISAGSSGISSGTTTPYEGGDFVITAGNGAQKNGSGSANGGDGGDVTVTAGSGGRTQSTVGTDSGGDGGDITLSPGQGGNGDAGSSDGGHGGSTVLTAAVGGSSVGGTAGSPGMVVIKGAAGGVAFGLNVVRSTVSDAATITDAQHRGMVLYQDASGGNVTMTTRTGTQLDAAFPDAVTGTAIAQYLASNHATNTSELIGGTGVTLVGSGFVTETGGMFLLIRTGAATWDLVRVG